RTGAGLTTEVLDERIDALGGALLVDVGDSAATFHATVISRSLGALADLLVGVLSRPSLAAGGLAKLKRETVAELVDARDHDRELGQKWFRKMLFDGHPFGRSVSGTMASVESIGHTDVTGTFGTALGAKNLVFAFAGDIDEERAR